MTLTIPFSIWMFVICRLVLDVVYLCTKFEDISFTHFKYMKKDQKI